MLYDYYTPCMFQYINKLRCMHVTWAEKALGIFGCADVLAIISWTMKNVVTSISEVWAIAAFMYILWLAKWWAKNQSGQSTVTACMAHIAISHAWSWQKYQTLIKKGLSAVSETDSIALPRLGVLTQDFSHFKHGTLSTHLCNYYTGPRVD